MKNKIKIEENKNEKFRRLAQARVNKTLKNLELIANLANKNTYDYTKDEANHIIKALDKKVKEVRESFLRSFDNEQFIL